MAVPRRGMQRVQNMDNQEQLQALSRDEYIRIARESCTRNLGYNGGTKNHGKMNKGYAYTEKIRPWDQSEPSHRSELVDSHFTIAPFKVKSLLIRLICALVLFLSIFLFDKFDLKVKTFNSKNIQEMVSSNQSIDEAETFFVNLFEQFVKSEE